MEEELTNRELAHMIGDVAKDVSEIKIQTKLTNGRTTAIEMARQEEKGRKTVVHAVVNTIVLPIAITIIIHFFTK